jgi:hypothetical protein
MRCALAARDWYGLYGDGEKFGGNLPPLIPKEIEPKVRVNKWEDRATKWSVLNPAMRNGKWA